MYDFKSLSIDELNFKEKELNKEIDLALYDMKFNEKLNDLLNELEAVRKEQKSRAE